MNDTPSPSTLRELRTNLGAPLTLVLMATAALVLTLMGAFGTGDLLGFPWRLAYWSVIVWTTYCVGYLASEGTWSRLRGRAPNAVVIAVAAVLTGLGVTATVVVVNGVTFGAWLDDQGIVTGLATVFAIAALVSTAIHLVQMQVQLHQGGDAAETAPAILDRVPIEKRGDLVALSVEDHYVRVRTTQGEEMILMRLSDAIVETAPVPGLRVHRSHWVARDQVAAARRDGDRAILTLSHGGDIPASRSHIPALKDAGILPR